MRRTNWTSSRGMVDTRILFGLGAVVLLGLAFFFFFGRDTGETGDGPVPGNAEAQTPPDVGATADPSRTAPVPVAVHVLTSGRAEGAVRAWGTIRPSQKADILAEIAGRVEAVHVALGHRVKQGQVLLEIDPDLYVARAGEAKSKLESTRLAEEKAKKDLDRTEALFRKGTVSDSEAEAARTRFAEAQAVRAAAEAALAAADKNLAAARLRAPFDGSVASRPPDKGSSVSIGMPLISIVDIRSLRVEVLLSEQDLGRVRRGDEAVLTVDSLPGRTFTGKVTAVGPQTDAATKQFPVEISVGNPEGRQIRGGMVARVEIVYETHDDVPLLPVDAMIETEDGVVFYTVENGVAHERTLVAGPRQGQRVAVLEGASAGDSVVVLGQIRLVDGSPVSVEEVN